MYGRHMKKAPRLLAIRGAAALILVLALSIFPFATVMANTVSANVIDGEQSYTFNMSSTSLEDILAQAEERGIPLWVRHVVVPGLNDSLEDMGKIKALAESFSNLEKMEWLPFHNLCVEKYQSMGIPFPLAGTDNMDEEALQRLVDSL